MVAGEAHQQREAILDEVRAAPLQSAPIAAMDTMGHPQELACLTQPYGFCHLFLSKYTNAVFHHSWFVC